MKKEAEQAATSEAASMPDLFPGMAVFNGNFFESYVRSGQVFFDSAFNLNQELMRFAADRIQADAEAFQTMAQCTNVQDMMGCQSKFAQTMADAYLAEIPKVTEQAARTCAAIWAPVFESAEALPTAVKKS